MQVDAFIHGPDFKDWRQQQEQKEEFGILTTCGGSKLTANLVVLLKVHRTCA